MTALWITLGVLVALVLASMVGMFLLLAMGRLHLDLGWGRSVHELGPIVIRIAAPRELVFEIVSAPYVGRTPAGSGIDVIAKSDALVVAAHHTKVHFYTARTVEVVEFQPPTRVGFRHVTGRTRSRSSRSPTSTGAPRCATEASSESTSSRSDGSPADPGSARSGNAP